MFISAKRNASVKAVTMTWTRYDASVMQKFMILADIAAPSAALSSVVVAAVTYITKLIYPSFTSEAAHSC